MIGPKEQPHYPLSNLHVTETGILSFKVADTIYRIKIISGSNHKLSCDDQKRIEQICRHHFSNVDFSSMRSCKIVESQGSLKITVNKETIEYENNIKRSKDRIKATFQPFLNFFTAIFDKEEPSFLKIESDLYDLISNLDAKTRKALMKNILNITPAEKEFFKFLKENIDFKEGEKNEILLEILSGAYVTIEDGGKTYQKWKKEAKKRVSSHESCDTQYSIRGPVLKECLFSTKKINDKTVTWFQLERYTSQDIVRHGWTYMLYRLHEKNQGPYGSSAYWEGSEKSIILKLKEV